jgi:hypothetical protein
MRLSGRALTASALALVAGLTVGVGLVAARGDIETNSLIYHTAPDELEGNVTSPEPACIPQRTVRVKKVRNGADRLIFERKTKPNGWYEKVVPDLRSGAYYGAVKRRATNAGVCAPIHSNTTTIILP